jgi:hypothetical protein
VQKTIEKLRKEANSVLAEQEVWSSAHCQQSRIQEFKTGNVWFARQY